jgi:alpha-galactosidase
VVTLTMNMRCVLLAVTLLGAAGVRPADALDNGLALTPPMGYNSWYDLMCSPYMNETTLERTADAMVAKGLVALGYEYLNLDDCYVTSRDAQGALQPDPKTFSKGMKSLGDYAHSKNMKFGVYTDRGTKTCGGRPAAEGHEAKDAATYASWGVDYLKEDSCNAPGDHPTAFKQYGAMRDGLNATGRPIVFSLCGWNSPRR